MAMDGSEISKTTAIIACTSMTLLYVAILYTPTFLLRLPPPDSFKSFMIRRFICAAVSSIVSLVLCAYILPVRKWDLSNLLGVYGIRLDHIWQAVIIPLSLTSLMYAGSLILKSLLLLDSWKDHWNGDRISCDSVKDIVGKSINWMQSVSSNIMVWRNFIVAPVTEELVFRACMIPLLLCGGLTTYNAVFLCPVFFSLAHLNHLLDTLQNRSLLQASIVVGFQLGYAVIFEDSHAQALAPVEYKIKTRSLRNKHRKQFNDDPVIQFAIEALKAFNQTSPQKYQLLKLGSFIPVALAKCVIFHINFMAKHADVAAAPEEMFFTELTNSLTDGLVIRLCVSLGPINSISGDRLNGCRFCCHYHNVWHPKGGFVRGADTRYKTLQDICDINLKNAIPDREKHLPLLKQVSGSPEIEKEGEYISEQVDDASLYATEALKFYNQHCNYELVEPGYATRVILPKCTLFHVNFKAKETVPIAPEKLFFTELTSSGGVLSVKCSMALSPSDIELGDETGDKTNGCYYCHEFNKVRHPLCGRFVRGGDSLYISAKEFLCLEETQLT